LAERRRSPGCVKTFGSLGNQARLFLLSSSEAEAINVS
jgi:hypothetical protein